MVDVATGTFVVDAYPTTTSYTATLAAGKTYKWNVAADNAAGESGFTTLLYFTTPAATPPTPTSPSPGSTISPGPTTASSTVTLSWGASSGATYYDLGVVDVATGTFVVDAYPTTTSYTVTLAAGKTYKWNVAADNAAGESGFTTLLYFTTPPGSTPVLSVTPLNPVTQPVTAGSMNLNVNNTGIGTMSYSSSVTSVSAWLSITSGGSGGNSGTIVVSYTANTTGVQRSATIQVAASGATGSPVTVTVTQASSSGSIVAGFDREFFPAHADTMADLIQRTNLKWCGYYLGAPSQRLDTGWLGERSYLVSLGWQIAPLYVGQQDPNYAGGDLSYDPSAAQGVIDGNEVVTEMGPDTGATQIVYGYDSSTGAYDIPITVAKGQGFSLGTTVYLDWESSTMSAGNDTDYVVAWCRTVAGAGYQPGIYCHPSEVAVITPLLTPYGITAQFWVANWTQPSVPATTTQFLTTNPTMGQASATSWQYGSAYSIQTINGILSGVDLDTSSLYGGSAPPDTTPPALTISSPVNGAVVTNANLPVSGTASDSGLGNNGVSVTVNGIAATGGTASGSGTANWSATATLVSGVNTITVVAKDTLNNSTQKVVSVTYNPPETTPPALTIASPANGAVVTSASLMVSGTASDNGYGNSGISSVTVNGISASGGTASGSGTANWSATVTLVSGVNTITVVAKDTLNNSTQKVVSVTFSNSVALPQQLSGCSMSNGVFHFTLKGPVGTNYVIEVSSNLVNWTLLSTNTIPANGAVNITNPVQPNWLRRFYRAVPFDTHIVFSDTFSGNIINTSKWTTSGNTVLQSTNTMQVLTTVTDQPGTLTSKPFVIASAGLITITRQMFLHHDDSVYYLGNNHFFTGFFTINVSNVPPFSVEYCDYDYSGGGLQPTYGFFITRNGANATAIASQADVSPGITAIWDTWFSEKITYDLSSGQLQYFINNTLRTTFNVGAMPVGTTPTMSLYFQAYGWWTGHEQLFQYLVVSQQTP